MFPQYSSFGFWLLQVVVGAIFIVHGWPKMKNPSGIAQTLGAPKFVGFLQGLVEVVGGLLIIFNLVTQWVALLFALIMLGAIYFKVFKWKTGFFSHNATGWEFDLLLLAVFVMMLTK